MSDGSNPLCACGCGREVARPWNRYILGHSTPARKLTTEQVRDARIIMLAGMSQGQAAKLFGVSQPTMNFISFNPQWGEQTDRGRDVVRLAEIIERQWLWWGGEQMRAIQKKIKEMTRGHRSNV